MDKMDLPTLVDEMKVKDYGVFRRRVMQECGVSRTTFYQWRNGRGVCFLGCAPKKIVLHSFCQMPCAAKAE